MSPGADRVLPALRQSQTGAPDSNEGKPAPLTPALRVLRRVLPWAMAAVLLAGVGAGARLAVSLGQPFPGFALMWRKELKLLVVMDPLQTETARFWENHGAFNDVALGHAPRTTEIFTWIASGRLELAWALRVDTLTAVMLIVVTPRASSQSRNVRRIQS